jgi:hypothetical protein
MKDTWRAGLKSLEVERNVANLHHYAERSRHHTKDKQRLVLSVVAYDSAPGTRLRFCALDYDFVRWGWPAGPSPSRSSCRGRINSYAP